MSPLTLSTLIFAQNDPGAGAASDAVGVVMAILMMIFGLVLFAAMIALVVWVFYTFYTGLDAIPQQFRTMEPGMIFLLLIPCFGIIWLFFVVTKIPESFRNYFWATDEHRYGDCGATLGMWYAILSVIGAIPYLGLLASIPGLICMILFLMKINEMKKAVLAGVASGKVPQGGQPGYGSQAGQYAGDPNNPYAPPEQPY